MILKHYYRKVGAKKRDQKVKRERDREVRASRAHLEKEWGGKEDKRVREEKRTREHGQERKEEPCSPLYSDTGYLAVARLL